MRMLLLGLLLRLCASSQIAIKMNDAPPLTISAQDFAQLPRASAVLHDHGQDVAYEGVLLHDVLVKAGVDFGKGLHGKQLSAYVSASASNGYQVVFALAEFDPTVAGSSILIADKRRGGPLSTNEGSYRIVVPNDKRPARSLRMLQEIDVVQLKK